MERSQPTVTMEFHVSRLARDWYEFDEKLFAYDGNVIFANFHAARVFAQRMNEKRDLIRFPEQAVKAGQINALGLIDELLHFIADLYQQQRNPSAFQKALQRLHETLDPEAVDKTLIRFVEEFPPLLVYRGEITPAEYLNGETAGIPNRQLALEELLMLWLTNANPATDSFKELFDDTALTKETIYPQIISELHDFFDTQPPFGPDNQNLIDMLHTPALKFPHSLIAQLEFIRERWGSLLGSYLYRLLGSLDLIHEEEKIIFPVGGPGPTRVYEFKELEVEPEQYSPDLDWMPQVVLMAKHTYVWLDQLSKKYQRPIQRLDQIPDQELDTLARWGFTGLWLIGLWERSPASKKIKQLCGNPDAEASAYALFDYQLAGALGGEEAYQNLRDRAWLRGIRLASDMVPNHMGIDSRWVMEHPDWFISLDYSPFPAYTFNGPDLSWNDQVGIFLEDHYYDRTDAAVVFKRVDRRTGEEKYIYHGNDGTSMPWNDTAQLNFLNAEVREAVIQTILYVARKFPIIRFDAAMTLTKKHYQRLWFPEPGTGGAIPSRADHGMTREAFEALMPKEFWREVVDRVAEEAPDTLLLAEAFWLMEGYFVRTLGMHRVYNSAFMNMLKSEENAKYRSVIKNTLEFDPQILKRYVNFMNNPDEDSAVAQFGKDDKYFGVCTLMATMPGLPMFGHGQIEGFAEKYGMEYRRAYWDEQPDESLIARHEREIFPLLRKRYLFAEVDNFLLYDFVTPEGEVNEDVFAYSNRAGSERALVVYHNKYAETRGWIRRSVPYLAKAEASDERVLVQKNLGEGLNLKAAPQTFSIFRDHATGLEYIRRNTDLFEKGLYVELAAFKYQVFLDWREIEDDERGHYGQLTDYLDGRGVPSIDEALREIFLQPIHHAFEDLCQPAMLQRLVEARCSEPTATIDADLLDEVEQKIIQLLREVKAFTGSTGDEQALAGEIRQVIEMILQLPIIEERFAPAGPADRPALDFLLSRLNDDLTIWGPLLMWGFVHRLGKIMNGAEAVLQSRSGIDEWLLGRVMTTTLEELGLDAGAAGRSLLIINILTSHQRWFETAVAEEWQPYRVLQELLQDPEVQSFLQVNRYQEILWFNHESFEELLWWLMVLATLDALLAEQKTDAEIREAIRRRYAILQQLQQAEAASEYQVEKLLDAARAITTEVQK